MLPPSAGGRVEQRCLSWEGNSGNAAANTEKPDRLSSGGFSGSHASIISSASSISVEGRSTIPRMPLSHGRDRRDSLRSELVATSWLSLCTQFRRISYPSHATLSLSQRWHDGLVLGVAKKRCTVSKATFDRDISLQMCPSSTHSSHLTRRRLQVQQPVNFLDRGGFFRLGPAR